MYKGILQTLSNNLKKSSYDDFQIYNKLIDIFELILLNKNQCLTQLDNLTILSLFDENIKNNTDIFKILQDKKRIIFPHSEFKNNILKILSSYLENKTIFKKLSFNLLNLSDKYSLVYPQEFSFFKAHINLIENIYKYPSNNIEKDIFSLDSCFKVHSTKYFNIIRVVNSEIPLGGYSFFSKDGLSLRFCLSGEIKFENYDKILCKNNCLISRRFFLGNYYVFTKQINYIFIQVKEEFLNDFFKDSLEQNILENIYFKLNNEYIEAFNNFDNGEYLNLITFKLISEMLINLKNKTNSLSKLAGNISTYIDSNLYDVSVAELQEKFFLNKNNIISLFKEEFSLYPSEYILNKKLEQVALKLLISNTSISNIAFSLNFSNPGTLSKTFKEKYGVSPLAFRKNIKKLSLTLDLDLNSKDHEINKMI